MGWGTSLPKLVVALATAGVLLARDASGAEVPPIGATQCIPPPCVGASWSPSPEVHEPGPKEVAAEENSKGLAAMARHEFEDAIRHFEAAKQHDPQQPAYQQNWQRAVNLRDSDKEVKAAQAALARGELDNAQAHLKKALALNPGSATNNDLQNRLKAARQEQEYQQRLQQILADVAKMQADEARLAWEQSQAAKAARQVLSRIDIRRGDAFQQLIQAEQNSTKATQELHHEVEAHDRAENPFDLGQISRETHPAITINNKQSAPVRLQLAQMQQQLDALQKEYDDRQQQLILITSAEQGAQIQHELQALSNSMKSIQDKMLDLSFAPPKPENQQ
jgi:hypothetical protein